MTRLIDLLLELKETSRAITKEEDDYLRRLGEEMARASNDAERWRILEREGLPSLEGFDLKPESREALLRLRRAAMN